MVLLLGIGVRPAADASRRTYVGAAGKTIQPSVAKVSCRMRSSQSASVRSKAAGVSESTSNTAIRCLGVDHGHDDLRSSSGCRRAMWPGKASTSATTWVLATARGGPADAVAEGDAQAAQRALVGPDHQLLALVRIDHVEAGPVVVVEAPPASRSGSPCAPSGSARQPARRRSPPPRRHSAASCPRQDEVVEAFSHRRGLSVAGRLDKHQRHGVSKPVPFRGSPCVLPCSFPRSALVGAAPAATPAFAQAQEGPSRVFTGRDIFGIRTASDPQVRPDGGAIAYVRTDPGDHDRQRPAVDLAGRSAERSPDTAGRRRGGQLLAALGRRTGPGSPMWPPGPAGRSSTSAGWPPAARPEWRRSSTPPTDIAWSPDGRSIAFIMLVEDAGKPLAQPMAKPDGAKWAEPLKQIDRVNYRADGARLPDARLPTPVHRLRRRRPAAPTHLREVSTTAAPIDFSKDGKLLYLATTGRPTGSVTRRRARSIRSRSPTAR